MSLIYALFYLSILLHTASFVINLFFIIPLQVKQSRVKNGLIGLRKQMLFWGISFQVLTTASILALTMRFFISDPIWLRSIVNVIIFIHATSMIMKAILLYKIYHTQFSPENVSLHAKHAKDEK